MGPLAGFRILEIAGIGPGPFCGMMLADMGAEIIRVDRASSRTPHVGVDPSLDVTARGRKSVALDLKHPEAARIVLRLCSHMDGLIEGFRPGVMERLGLGPEQCLAENPRLVYGRMTGWGQSGPLAQLAGHDINYLAISGSLYMLGRAGERPSPPLNLVADMGGGGLVLAFGMVCALLERERSGRGQVVDAAMSEGAAVLASMVYAQRATGWWHRERGTNLLDSGAHFYEVYDAKDGGYVAVGAIEPQFYSQLLQGLQLDPATLPAQMDRSAWPEMKMRFAAIFRTRTRDEWMEVFANGDSCVSPVLSPEEAADHPQAVARGAFRTSFGVLHPAPAPRFSRSRAGLADSPPAVGQHTEVVLRTIGFSDDDISSLRAAGAIA
jgi:alpha-methylacyl-CoA racemase